MRRSPKSVRIFLVIATTAWRDGSGDRTKRARAMAVAKCKRKERAHVQSERDDETRAQKSGVSHRRRLAGRQQVTLERRNRRFINPSLRLVESFGSASAVAANDKQILERSAARSAEHIFLFDLMAARVFYRNVVLEIAHRVYARASD